MKKKRNGSIDFWKFVFSIVIIIFHGKNLAQGQQPIFIGGSIGVEFFFIVSGMLMANSASRNTDTSLTLGQDTFHFMKKKICGLMPNIYVAWVIAFFVEHIGKFEPVRMIKDAASAVWELLFLTESGLLGYRANTVCWYISAMLLVMFILYPLMRRYKDTYFYIIAPLLVIFVMGLTYHDWKNLRLPHAWYLFSYKSLVRALMGIGIGTLGFKVSAYLRGQNYTRLMRGIFTVIEWGLFGAVLAASYAYGPSKYDWLLVLLLAVAITVTFAQVDLTDAFFSSHSIFSWLGEFSFSLYLGHGYWSHKITKLFPDMSYYQRIPVYLLISILTGLVIMYVSDLLKKWWAKNRDAVRKKVIQE